MSLHSLYSQKKGAVQSLVLLVMVAAMVIGILSVTAAHSKTITFSPIFTAASVNQSYNFTVALGAGSATINEIRITKPGDFTAIYCLNANPVGSWSCATNGTTSLVSYVEFTGGSLAAGSEVSINITATSAAGAANYTFNVRTQGNGEAANTSDINVTVDAHPPVIKLVNITDGTNVISGGDVSNRTFFLNNATKGIVFVINVTDNSSGMAQGRVSFYYNVTNVGIANRVIDYRNGTLANHSEHVASNGTFGELSLYNVTLNLSGLPTLNGSSIAFQIIANDSVKNFNWSNTSMQDAVSSYNYNFTIDAVAPQFVDVQVANQSLNAGTATAINITSVLTSKFEYIINSSLILNVSALVRDDGGSGTIKVEVLNRSGAFMGMALLTGANGSSTQTTWNFSTFNISDLVVGFAGDGLYNLTFRATDNVTNVNSTYNFTVEVDDTPPTGSVATNLTIGGILSAGNMTSVVATNSSFNITVITVSNINNNTGNVSIVGNLGNFVNLSNAGGTPSGTSFWSVKVENNTLTGLGTANMSTLCDHSDVDGKQCNIQVRFSDVMGRVNNSVNLTLVSDALAPNVSILSPVSFTKNYTGTALINVSVNDTVGPISNVSFRIRRNMTAEGSIEGFYNNTHINVTNVTNWIPMTLGTGSNTQFLTNGTWNFTVNLTALNFSEGINYTIEINVTDSAGRQNTSVNVSKVVFDSSVPTNITVMSGLNVLATNSFQKAMFNITANATEITSGLLNVSFRIENNSFNWPWVDGSQVVTALTAGQSFNASQWNFTHWGGEPTNATNGNFTLRLNVTDTAGNQNTSVTINFTIDTIVPAVSMVFPGNNQNQSANFTVNISVTESNNNNVQYRWENATYVDATSEGGNVSNWINMNNVGGANNWNSTFNITEGTPADGNFTIKINVTDKAGNSNASVYIQLLLDQSRPEVVAVGILANSQQTDDFIINMTTRDNRSFLNVMGLFNVSNINATAVRLENNTFNGSWQNISFATTDLGNVGNSNRTNVTFEFTSVSNGRYNIRFWTNDTAGNQNSTVLITNITLDNIAPGVAVSIVNVSPAISGDIGASGTIAFNASITDNLPLNISITNLTITQTQTFGVFYRFENSTFNGSWLPMSTPSFNQSSVHNNTGREQTAVFNASNTTTALADGDYKIRINATDMANKQNASVTIDITIQNSATNPEVNWSFLGGFISGSDLTNPVANSTPQILFNTSTNATCRYSVDTQYQKYQHLPNTLNNNVSKSHNAVLGSLRDGSHTIYYSCIDVAGSSMPLSNNITRADTFNIDTRTLWNVTIPGATDSNWPNYWSATPSWHSFVFTTGVTSSLSTAQGGYNVTNVLASLLKGTAEGNFTRIYAYTASTNSWETFIVGQIGNTFINFTNQTTYWINVTAKERLEVN